jgi:hypothetical protein
MIRIYVGRRGSKKPRVVLVTRQAFEAGKLVVLLLSE